MAGTNVYAAKRALLARLAALAAPAQPLAGVQVAYERPAPTAMGAECVYGGGVRFTHEDAVAERPAPIVTEVALASWYIRGHEPQAGLVATTDARAEEILAAVVANLYGQPQLLPGKLSFTGVTLGRGEYDQAPGESLTVLAVQVRVESDLSYG